MIESPGPVSLWTVNLFPSGEYCAQHTTGPIRRKPLPSGRTKPMNGTWVPPVNTMCVPPGAQSGSPAVMRGGVMLRRCVPSDRTTQIRES